MKFVIRRIDNLGRILIPRELREAINVQKGDAIEIIVENNRTITLKPHTDKNYNDMSW